MTWAKEHIPSNDVLFYRIYKSHVDDGEVMPGCFREKGNGESKGMSTDWSRYSTAEQSKERAKTPSYNGIISFITGDIRGLSLTVAHDPIENHPSLPNNRAHTNISGIGNERIKKTETRLKLTQKYKWEIKI